GDGLLAIFPVGSDAAMACAAALAAAREVQASLAAADDLAALGGGAQPGFGLALHLGEVLFGNIGGGHRPDFTCIGPAVQPASRIEKLTGEIGQPILASEAFARHCGAALMPLGAFPLRGFGAAQSVFGLADALAGAAP